MSSWMPSDEQFDLDTLTVYSVGLFVVNQCQNGWMHDDFNNVDGKAFNILIPLNLPKRIGVSDSCRKSKRPKRDCSH